LRTILSYPGNMAHAQNVALAMLEAGILDCFVTGCDWRARTGVGRGLAQLSRKLARPLHRHAARKAIKSIPPNFVHTFPLGETARVAASAIVSDPILADRIWDWSSHRFDAHVARRYVPRTQVIQAFEYTALSSFERAAQLGVARVLHLPSLDSRCFEEIQRREKQDWPELVSPTDAYFDAKFERRYARRRAEIELADVVVANSSLTARSHIAAGADPAKVCPVPLGAPPPVKAIMDDDKRRKRQLVVVWAGSFSLRKGAHYIAAAWRRLKPGAAARLDIYGKVTVPERVLAGLGEEVRLQGAKPQSELFAAYESADILVFPTLSDGFGMVVAEAFAHGLPVITTDQAGASDLVTPDNGLIVPAADEGALAVALLWCLDNRDRLLEMRHHALETARKRQWLHFRRDLLAVLTSGLARAGYSPHCQNS
jgi:glycosyltransferase involved in cell wall biosynthesis